MRDRATENVVGLLDFLTKPLQWVIRGIKFLSSILLVWLAVLVMFACGIMHNPAERAQSIEFLSQQAHRITCPVLSCYPEDFKVANPQAYLSASPFWGIENNGPMTESEHGLAWAFGKQAPMFAAYYKAETTARALRSVVGALASLPPERVKLAPVPVNVSYVRDIYFDGGYQMGDSLVNNEVAVNYGEAPAVVITGMCIAKQCQPEDFEFTNTRDLISGPSVSPHQQNAIDALDSMQADSYWMETARLNGVDASAAIAGAAEDNRQHLSSLPILPTSAYVKAFATVMAVVFIPTILLSSLVCYGVWRLCRA